MHSKVVISLLMVPSIDIQRSLVSTGTCPFISIGSSQSRCGRDSKKSKKFLPEIAS
jgi:hypothetical protein